MKIKTDEQVFILPVEDSINVLVDRGFKKDIIESLNLYFNKKKKTKCLVYDEDNNLLKFDEIGFVYLENDNTIDDNLELKPKTEFNNEISSVIEGNPEMFMSLDKIRESLKDILTDKGTYELKRILSYGLKKNIGIEINDFDISKIIQVFAIEYEDLSISEKKNCIFKLITIY